MSYKLRVKDTKKSRWRDVRYRSLLTGKLKKPIIYRTKAKAILDKNTGLLAEKKYAKSLRVYKVKVVSTKLRKPKKQKYKKAKRRKK